MRRRLLLLAANMAAAPLPLGALARALPAEPRPASRALPPPPAFAAGWKEIFREDFDALSLRTCPGADDSLITPANNDRGYPDIKLVWPGPVPKEIGGYKYGEGRWSPHGKWPNASLAYPAYGDEPKPAFLNPRHPALTRIGYSPFKVEDSVLTTTLEAPPPELARVMPPNPATGEPFRWVSGSLTTRWSFYFQFGYMECLAWFPPGLVDKGYFAAPLWTLAQNGKWPPEIDASEIVNDRSHLTVIDGKGGRGIWTEPGIGGRWVRLGALWEPGRVTKYVDGQPAGAPETSVAAYDTDTVDTMHHLVHSLSCGGKWAGANVDGLPHLMRCDWIRVLQPPGGKFYNSTGPHPA
ncbi:glycoside hydrolase family 16 protein [Salinarimonas soli]|uniref:GH16 domain-containing protein n=1 Tax=Salinarimonas soli TaxID=1638099 RepID=A0A5B2V5C0_9HYPH|nr:hypothetical protein [Salinarimonas soli]KAA2234164.1 hypothetical protein F0L46_24225 [Salinarimonas soli]